jgi:hypothetical protein
MVPWGYLIRQGCHARTLAEGGSVAASIPETRVVMKQHSLVGIIFPITNVGLWEEC